MSTDERTSIPIYSRIRSHLLEAIERGQMKPGDRVPSERELTEQFSVSRMTARQALQELETQGYLHRIQGKGTFVTEPKINQTLTGLTSFTEDMRRRGMQPGAVVLAVEEVTAGRRVAEALEIDPADSVFRLERLRLANGEPMALEACHIATRTAPGLIGSNFEQHSLYEILRERYGIRLRAATQSLEAVAAREYEATMLQVREGAPLLLIERISTDAAEHKVEFVRSLYRGDRYRFMAELRRTEEGAHGSR